jgi:hypothetical protein
MGNGNILITGTPRSGTTLTCHLLNKLPNVVALDTPMRPIEMQGPDGTCKSVERFCEEQRRSILERKTAVSQEAGGAVVDNAAGTTRTADGLREKVVAKGEIIIDKDLSPDFTLVIKQLGTFTALLDQLVTGFLVYAVVRNPLPTLASWNTVTFPIRRGRVPNAEHFERGLRAQLKAIEDVLDRQIYLLGWFHERLRHCLPEDAIIRYEAIVETGGKALAVVVPAAAALDEPLQSQNTSALYDRETMLRIGERLLESEGAYWNSYSKESVERLLGELTAAPLH